MWTVSFFLITSAAVRLIKVALMLAKIVNKPQSVHVTELSVLTPFFFFVLSPMFCQSQMHLLHN